LITADAGSLNSPSTHINNSYDDGDDDNL